jgi:hypothetical protein
MDDATRQAMLNTLGDLRAFVEAGGHIEWSEPPERARKGPD